MPLTKSLSKLAAIARRRREHAHAQAELRRPASSAATASPVHSPKPRPPPWLQNMLHDDKPASPPPRTYVWTLANLRLPPRCTADAPVSPSSSSSSTTTSSSTSSSLSRSNITHNHSAAASSHSNRIFVLGLGNLGKLYATCLAQLPNPPPITLVVHRRSLLEQWAANPGIEMKRHGITHRLASDLDLEWWTPERPTTGPVREAGACVDSGGQSEGGHIANLIVATKAAQALPEVDKLRRYLDASSSVLFVQNGMSRLWPPHGPAYCAWRWPDGNHPTFLHGITKHGVYTEGPFKSVHAALADVVIGTVCQGIQHNQRDAVNDDNGASRLTRLIVAAPHLAGRAASRQELWVLQLEKLVINAIINPLTALLRVRNGGLFAFAAQPPIENKKIMAKVIDKLLAEISTVLQALVQHESSREILVPPHNSPFSSSLPQIQALVDRFSVPKLREMLYTIGAKVQLNKSSMLQDVEAGKPTEIREFNGWLVDTAAAVLGEEASMQQLTGHQKLIELVEKGIILDEQALGKLLGCVTDE